MKSTSVSNNNVLHVTRFYVGGKYVKKNNNNNVSQSFGKKKHLLDIKSSALVMNLHLCVTFLMLLLHDRH